MCDTMSSPNPTTTPETLINVGVFLSVANPTVNDGRGKIVGLEDS